MMRVIGSLLLAGGFGVMGLLAARQLSKRVALLAAWQMAVAAMSAELSSRLTAIPELVKRTAETAPPILRPILEPLAAALERPGGRRYADIWREIVMVGPMDGEEKNLLAALGQRLGQFELSGQIAALEAVHTQLGILLSGARERRERLGRVYGMGGFLSGLAVVLLLL